MGKIWAVAAKELLLLRRDIVGILLLFIMPMLLLLFISMTQSAESGSSQKINLLLLNQDNSSVASTLEQNLAKNKNFEVKILNKKKTNTEQATEQVAKGEYQAFIIIPNGMGEQINNYSKQVLTGGTEIGKPKNIVIWFDPAISNQLKNSMISALNLIVSKLELTTRAELLKQSLKISTAKAEQNLFSIQDKYAGISGLKPNAVQQNVPAWALFGMFFIVAPLGGMMVKEREMGVMQRLQIAPISTFSLMLGKIIAFLLINQLQLWLMLLEGVYVLPYFGLPMLNLIGHLWPVFIIGLCASFAATGFGVLMGAYAKTLEQASIVAPFIIVIFAAVGGILVPIYVMPESLQAIAIYSPLNWAHQSFVDVFVRDAQINDVKINLVKLLLFFVVTFSLAMMRMKSSRARLGK